jgi:hypothetical protein
MHNNSEQFKSIESLTDCIQYIQVNLSWKMFVVLKEIHMALAVI